MGKKESNAKKGSSVVDELIKMLKARDLSLLYACDSVVRTIDHELPAKKGITVKKIIKSKEA